MRNVIIYSTPSCHYCHMAKDFFSKNNIQYVDKDLATDEAARAEAIKKSGQLRTPVIDIDGTIVVGFDKATLKKMLGINP